MKIIFFGTSEFAVESLRVLISSGYAISAVVTQPDRKKGRNLLLSPPPVKVLAETQGLNVYQPQNASSIQSINYIKSLGADLFVVVAFGQILKQELLAVPRLYSINLHGSLLPKYRGAAPTNWAIINGDSMTGVTAIKMNEKMDEGDIMAKREVPIEPDDTNITLSENLSEVGAGLLAEVIAGIASGKEMGCVRQDPALATLAPKLLKADGLIRWEWDAVRIHNRVRGLLPWPGAYTNYKGKILKILKTQVMDTSSEKSDLPAGSVVDIIKGRGMVICTGSNDILITHVQLEAGKELEVDAFLRGHRIMLGEKI